MADRPSTPSATVRPDTSASAESPRSATRKRSVQEVYQPAELKQSIFDRPSTAPESTHPALNPNKSDWQRQGFGSIGRASTEVPLSPAKQRTRTATDRLSATMDKASQPKQTSEQLMEDLEPYSWDDLEARYSKAMGERAAVEDKLAQEFKSLTEVFTAWAQTTSTHEDNRAIKRLRTRISKVQDEEKTLGEKKQHYVNVVKAFQNALDLLKNT